MNPIDSLRSTMASRSRRKRGASAQPPTMGQQQAPASYRSTTATRAVRPTELQSQASRRVDPSPSTNQATFNRKRKQRASAVSAVQRLRATRRGGL